ncbi:MAG: hypothetical protein KA129_03415 [Microthrixaceae bacterium]|nr:hypothetical protein [Microthrixaceae bacterium]
MARKSSVNVLIVGDATKLREGLADADRQLNKFGDSVKSESDKLKDFGTKAVLGAGVAAVGMWKAADAAADLGEATSKARTTFGDSFKDIEKFAGGADEALGQSKVEALGYASAFGMIGKSTGLAGKDLAAFSTDLATLATDFASFHNTEIPEAAAALESAFRGEFDPLQKYIPTINAATVETQALKMGLAATTSELTAQDKVLATKAYVMANAGDAMGDFARTSEGAANQQRILRAEFQNTVAQLGNDLMPVMQKVLGAGGAMVDVFSAIPAPLQQTAVMVGVAATGLAGVGGLLSTASGYVLDIKDAFVRVKESIGEKGLAGTLTSTGGAVAGLTVAVGAGLAVWDAWHTNVKRVDDEMKEVAKTIADEGGGTFDTLRDQLQNVLDTRDSFDESFKASGLSIAAATKAIDENVGAWDRWRGTNREAFDGLRATGRAAQDNGHYIDTMRARLDDFPPSVSRVVDNLLRMVEAEKLSANEFKETVDALVDTDQAAMGTADRIEYLAVQLRKAVPGAQNSAEALKLFADATGESDATLSESAAALEELKRLYPEYAEELGMTVTAADEMAAANEGAADATAAVASETWSAIDSLDAYYNKLRGATDPMFAMMSAGRALGDAQDEYNAAVNEFGAESYQAREALMEVTKASLDNAVALDEMNAKVRSGEVDFGEAGAAMDRWVAAGFMTAQQAKAAKTEMFLLALGAQELDRLSPNVEVTANIDDILWKFGQVEAKARTTANTLASLSAMSYGGSAPVSFDSFMGRASGGPVSGGTPYIVGEEGPELFVPGASGTIIPNHSLSSGGRSGGMSVTINVSAGVGDPVEIGRKVAEALKAYERHGGMAVA